MTMLRLCILLIVAVFLPVVYGGSHEEVLADERVFMVEFYSGMCGSCQEFAPTWAKLEKAAKNVATAKVNIDEEEGMKFAQKIGVLDEGLPNIRLFTSTAGNGISVLPGMPEPYKKIMAKVKGHLSSVGKRDDGVYIKSS